MDRNNVDGNASSRDVMTIPDIVEEQWQIQVCHIARLSRARRTLIVGWNGDKPVVYAAGKPGGSRARTPDVRRIPRIDAAGPARTFLLRTGGFLCLPVRCRAVPIRWPDGRNFGAIVMLSPSLGACPSMEDSYRFMVEETLRLGLQAARSKAEAGYEKPADPIQRELFSKMVCRSMNDKSIALLSIGADNGPQIREEFGAECHSQAMAVLARRMVSRVRNTDLICRLDDGRFLAMMRQADTLQRVASFTQKLLSAAREDIHLGDRSISLRVSIGVAFNRETVRDYDQLVRQANAAMYQARRTGGDRFVIFNPDMR